MQTLYGLKGSRGQTTVTPTSTENSTNQNTSSASMETATNPEQNEMIGVRIPRSTFWVFGGSKSANHHHVDTTVPRMDSARVVKEAKEKQKKDIQEFNEKYGTNF